MTTSRRTPPDDRPTRPAEPGRDAPRMRDITHVHRDHDPRAWHWFAGGQFVVTDGGEPDGGKRRDDKRRNVEEERLRDVSHVPAHGDGANRVWERGEDEIDDGDRDEDGA